MKPIGSWKYPSMDGRILLLIFLEYDYVYCINIRLFRRTVRRHLPPCIIFLPQSIVAKDSTRYTTGDSSLRFTFSFKKNRDFIYYECSRYYDWLFLFDVFCCISQKQKTAKTYDMFLRLLF